MSDLFLDSLQQALNLIFSGNPEVYGIVYRTIYVTGLGTFLACLWSIPLAILIGLYSFKGRWVVKGFFNAFIGIPTVALGLFLYLLFSHQGILGSLDLLYTLNGIAIGQAVLETPIIVSFVSNALGTVDIQLRDLARTLGASGVRTDLAIMRETVWSLVLAIAAAFNRGFGELGIAALVGGGLFGMTRVLTTAITIETNFGHFSIALAYGIILMSIVLAITLTTNLVERLKREDFTLPKWNIRKSATGVHNNDHQSSA
jgi:tungstate transport system permease protein